MATIWLADVEAAAPGDDVIVCGVKALQIACAATSSTLSLCECARAEGTVDTFVCGATLPVALLLALAEFHARGTAKVCIQGG